MRRRNQNLPESHADYREDQTNHGERLAVQQTVTNGEKATPKEVKAAVKQLNPDKNSMDSRG